MNFSPSFMIRTYKTPGKIHTGFFKYFIPYLRRIILRRITHIRNDSYCSNNSTYSSNTNYLFPRNHQNHTSTRIDVGICRIIPSLVARAPGLQQGQLRRIGCHPLRQQGCSAPELRGCRSTLFPAATLVHQTADGQDLVALTVITDPGFKQQDEGTFRQDLGIYR